MVVQLYEYTKNHELYTLNRWTLWFVDFISTKLLLKKKTIKHSPCPTVVSDLVKETSLFMLNKWTKEVTIEWHVKSYNKMIDAGDS